MRDRDVEDYLRRSGDDFLMPGKLFEHPDHGFAIFDQSEDAVIIKHVYGDGRYWVGLAEEIAREFGIKKIRIGTSRNPRTWERKYDFHVVRVGYIMEKEVR